VIRASSRLTVSIGFRSEFSTGWNEAHGRAADYTFTNGVINTDPHIGHSLFTTNNGKFLPQPRIGLAWNPLHEKTVVRAGFGMYNDLQDALGYRTDQNAPFNPTYNIASLAVSSLPIDPSAAVPTGAKLVAGGVQPDMKTPTLISWSLRVEQQISPNTSLTVGYVGSHGYHELVGVDANEPFPVICPAAPLPGHVPQHLSGSVGECSGAGRVVLHSVRVAEHATRESRARQYLDVVFGRRQQLSRDAGRREPAVQSWASGAWGVHVVKSAGRRRLSQCDGRRECARAGVESIQPARRLRARDLRCT